MHYKLHRVAPNSESWKRPSPGRLGAPGVGSYVGSADLVALGSDFTVGSTGRLFLEFYERFDDFTGATDGVWRSGSLTVTYVPEPTSFALAGIALLGLGAASRRSRQPQS